MKTYEIVSELFAIQEMIENESFEINEETGEVIDNTDILKEMMDDVNLLKDEKADSIIYMIKEFQDAEKALQAEVKRLSDRKGAMKRKQEQLKELLDFLLKGEKLKTEKFTIFYGSSTKTVIEDESAIDEKFLKVAYSVDKTAVKKALESFEEVHGAKLETTKSVRFR